MIDSFILWTFEFKRELFGSLKNGPFLGDRQYSPFLFSPHLLWCPKLGHPSRFYGALARNRNALGSAWFSCSLIVGAGCISCGRKAPHQKWSLTRKSFQSIDLQSASAGCPQLHQFKILEGSLNLRDARGRMRYCILFRTVLVKWWMELLMAVQSYTSRGWYRIPLFAILFYIFVSYILSSSRCLYRKLTMVWNVGEVLLSRAIFPQRVWNILQSLGQTLG